jgi:hypothetical protein
MYCRGFLSGLKVFGISEKADLLLYWLPSNLAHKPTTAEVGFHFTTKKNGKVLLKVVHLFYTRSLFFL